MKNSDKYESFGELVLKAALIDGIETRIFSYPQLRFDGCRGNIVTVRMSKNGYRSEFNIDLTNNYEESKEALMYRTKQCLYDLLRCPYREF